MNDKEQKSDPGAGMRKFRSLFRDPGSANARSGDAVVISDALPDGPSDTGGQLLGVTGYEMFSTMTLMATLASLRATHVMHGKTEHSRHIEQSIKRELEKRHVTHGF